jgi:hypothetical protein
VIEGWNRRLQDRLYYFGGWLKKHARGFVSGMPVEEFCLDRTESRGDNCGPEDVMSSEPLPG